MLVLVSFFASFHKRARGVHGSQELSQLDINQRWNDGAGGTEIKPRIEAIEAIVNLLKVAASKTQNVPQINMKMLFKDDRVSPACDDSVANAMLAFGGACYFLPEAGDRLPSAASLSHPQTRPPRWLSIGWFKRSPYSPVHVEAVDGLQGLK